MRLGKPGLEYGRSGSCIGTFFEIATNMDYVGPCVRWRAATGSVWRVGWQCGQGRGVVGRSVVGAIGCFGVVTCEVGVLVQLLCEVMGE